MKFEDVVEWLRSSPTNQAIVGGVAILVLILLILLLRRRGKNKPLAEVEEEAGRPQDTRILEVLELYKDTHPAFYRIMNVYGQKQSFGALLADQDFKTAFEKLRGLRAKKLAAGKDKKATGLQLSAPADRELANKETRAAMLTILRVLYLQPDRSTALTPQADAELDRLLESLTD